MCTVIWVFLKMVEESERLPLDPSDNRQVYSYSLVPLFINQLIPASYFHEFLKCLSEKESLHVQRKNVKHENISDL